MKLKKSSSNFVHPVFRKMDELAQMEPRYRFAYELKKFRETWHMSQRRLAERAQTTQRIISAIEAATYNPSLDLMIRIAGAFNARLDVSFKAGLNHRR